MADQGPSPTVAGAEAASYYTGDVVRGRSCFSALISALGMLDRRTVEHVFVSHRHKHLGIYVLTFYKDGEWVSVMVDDRIPCEKETRRPLIMPNPRP